MVKIGLSTYSLDREIEEKRMSLGEVLDFIAENGGECAELVPFGYRFDDPDTGKIDKEAIKKTVRRAKDAGVELVNYSVLADLCAEGNAFDKEIKRICHEVDIAAELGLSRMRHDISAFRRPLGQNGLHDFDALLKQMIEGASRIADYAKTRGVTTLIENHGFFVNGCDRVERVLNGVDRDNYGLLLDTGNIVCVDEDPSVAAYRLAGRAKMVHLKDFYIRKDDPGDSTQFDCGGHWFRSYAGRYLRGSILAQGDLDIPGMLNELKMAKYDGPVVIEFEGLEEAKYASSVSLKNARRLWDRA